MKTTKNITAIFIACLLVLTNFANAQDTDPAPGNHGNASSDPCTPNATTWFLGGNNIIPPPGYNPSNIGSAGQNLAPQTDAGTCNNFPFILKANNLQSVFILPSGNVGIGYAAPTTKLDVRGDAIQVVNSQMAGSTGGYTYLGRSSAPGTDSYFYHRITPNYHILGSGFNSGAPIKKIGFAMGGSDLESDVKMEIVANGNVGIGTSGSGIPTPIVKLQVADVNAAEINVYTTGGNPARLSLSTPALSYYFANDNTAGHIGADDGGGEHPIINFRYNNGEQVWIGNTTPQGVHADFKFAVNGKMLAQSIYVTASTSWADYVFAKDYKLPKLSEVEEFYKANKHLPEIPTTEEVAEKGINVGEMNTLLLKKVEELTLYVVDLNKKVETLQAENKKLLHK